MSLYWHFEREQWDFWIVKKHFHISCWFLLIIGAQPSNVKIRECMKWLEKYLPTGGLKWIVTKVNKYYDLCFWCHVVSNTFPFRFMLETCAHFGFFNKTIFFLNFSKSPPSYDLGYLKICMFPAWIWREKCLTQKT